MLIIPCVCARVRRGEKRAPGLPAARTLVLHPHRERARFSTTLSTRSDHHVTWSARAPIPSIFRLCPPPQFSNRDLRSRTLRSSSFAFPNLQFPTEDPLLSFPFLSFPVRLSSGRESKGRESTRGGRNFHVSFRSPSFLHRYFVQSGVIANFSLEGNEKWRSGSKGERRISMVRRVP